MANGSVYMCVCAHVCVWAHALYCVAWVWLPGPPTKASVPVESAGYLAQSRIIGMSGIRWLGLKGVNESSKQEETSVEISMMR